MRTAPGAAVAVAVVPGRCGELAVRPGGGKAGGWGPFAEPPGTDFGTAGGGGKECRDGISFRRGGAGRGREFGGAAAPADCCKGGGGPDGGLGFAPPIFGAAA